MLPPDWVDARQSIEDEELARALEESMRTAADPPKPPDVHSPIGLHQLFEQEYQHGAKADLWRAKLGALGKQYESVRPMRGEGNCFYRSFWMSWVDRLLSAPPPAANQSAPRHPLLADVHSSAWADKVTALSSTAAASLPEAQAAQVVALGTAFIERTRGLCTAFASAGEPELLTAARRTPETLEALRWLRLVASAYVRAHADDFAPFTDGRPIDVFCTEHIERDEELADEPQLQALTHALALGVRVEYLDGASAAWSERCGPHRHVLRIPPSAADAAAGEPPPALAACVLFRPGHYDMLRPRDWADASLLEPDGEIFVAPLPPPTLVSSCSACGYCQASCLLCTQTACVVDGCRAAQPLCTLPEALATGGLSAVCGSCTQSLPIATPPAGALASGPFSSSSSLREPPTVAKRSVSFGAQKLMRCSAGCAFFGFDGSQALTEHAQACEHVPRPCPSECGAALPRREMAVHLAHECPSRLVACHLGCGEQIRASESDGMKLHYKEGDGGHMQTCRKVQEECGCGTFVVRDKMDVHRQTQCVRRMITCSDGCGCRFRAMDADWHRASCTHAVVQCDWRCGAGVVRREMAGHKACCPQVFLRCPGCRQRVQRRDAKAHWASCAALPVLCAACDQLCLRRELKAHEESECIVLNPPQEPSPPKLFECGLCLNKEEVDNSFQPDCYEDQDSGHRFCFECIVNYAKFQIDGMGEDGDPTVPCPAPSCVGVLTNLQVEGLTRRGLAQSAFDKFVQLNIRKQITPCPGGCGWGIELRGSPQFLRCDGECRDGEGKQVWYCLHCLRDGFDNRRCRHDASVSCADHRRWLEENADTDDKNARYIAEHCKPCPGCGKNIEKKADEGGAHNCMKMHHREAEGCVPGGTKYCWCCLALQEPINAHDLSFHKPECLLWVACDEEKHERSCPACVRAGPGIFCDTRPRTQCTRLRNGDPERSHNYFCSCLHGCPCNSRVTVSVECQCGTDADGNPIPSNQCSCGKQLATCSSCNETRCRLCNRAPHVGFKCIEDRLPGDPSPEETVNDDASSDALFEDADADMPDLN